MSTVYILETNIFPLCVQFTASCKAIFVAVPLKAYMRPGMKGHILVTADTYPIPIRTTCVSAGKRLVEDWTHVLIYSLLISNDVQQKLRYVTMSGSLTLGI
jgi:hypothetical protein